MLRSWSELPDFMQVPEVKLYYEILQKHKGELVVKKIFDIILASILCIILAIPMLVIAVIIKVDSPGPIFYRQERITAYGKKFRIHKFRTMVYNADQIGTSITISNDRRITKIGKGLRKIRLDELPQIIDIIEGNMSFVGTRPEAVEYVKQYKPEYFATLLLPAGITSETSIRYKDEYKLLNMTDNVEQIYLEQVLPVKMERNLESLRTFSLFKEILTMIRTVLAVIGKEYN